MSLNKGLHLFRGGASILDTLKQSFIQKRFVKGTGFSS
jgi:hypothetical protein